MGRDRTRLSIFGVALLSAIALSAPAAVLADDGFVISAGEGCSFDVHVLPGGFKEGAAGEHIRIGFADITLTNGAPGAGVSSYIIGGDVGGPTRPGVNRTVVTLLTPHVPVAATDGAGTALPLSLGREGDGLYAASVVVEIPPGATTTIQLELQGAVATSGRYRLLVGHQPTRLPDRVSVRLQTTGGWTVERPDQPSATYETDGPSTFDVGLKEA